MNKDEYIMLTVNIGLKVVINCESLMLRCPSRHYTIHTAAEAAGETRRRGATT